MKLMAVGSQEWWDYGAKSAERANRSLRYWWLRFLDRRDAEIESLGEIVALAQSIDNGAYSNERILKNTIARRGGTA